MAARNNPVQQTAPATAEHIRQWCTQSQVPADRPELSDVAATLIAAGFLTPSGRAIIVRRVSSGLAISHMTGGFGQLRRLQRSIAQTEHQLRNPMVPGVVAAVMRNRLNGMVRRREDARKTIVTGKGVYAGNTRGIRRERRENIYLEIEERERLFSGLLYTPTPNSGVPRSVRKAGTVAVDRIVGVVGQVASMASNHQSEPWSGQGVGSTRPAPTKPQSPGVSAFVDGYETLLFLAGHYYDRVVSNPAWQSDHFQVQRTSVNLQAELAEIAADVIALRAVRIDLDRAKRDGGFDESFAAHIDQRETALRPVWTELIERVQALGEVAHVVESAAVELQLLNEYNKTSTIDDRIDALISRSGSREVSVDNSKRLTEQVRSGEEQLRVYRDVLQGNIARLSPAVPRELPERYEPESGR